MAWAAAFLVFPGALAAQTPAAGGGRTPPPAPVVVDANGQVVGGAFGLGVRVQVGDRAAVLQVGPSQFMGGLADVLFESSDCQGPAFLQPSVLPGVATLLEDVGVGPRNLLLAPGGAVETRTIRSAWVSVASPPACFSTSAVDVEVVPAVMLMDLSIFTPPFRIE